MTRINHMNNDNWDDNVSCRKCSDSGSIAVLEFGDGKLNPLGSSTRHAIHHYLEEYKRNPNVAVVILMGRGATHFSAGADMTEFSASTSTNTTTTTPTLPELCHYIEAYPKPIVAAIQGVALGGGLELALACHYRVAAISSSTKLGLPEVSVGVIPGAGGTQRLPRLVGISHAIRMITTGTPVSAEDAFQMKLVDGISPSGPNATLLDYAASYATWIQNLARAKESTTSPTKLPRACDIVLDTQQVQLACDLAMKKLPPKELGGFGVHAALEAIRACGSNSKDKHAFQKGCQVEQDLFFQTMLHPQGQARRHAFFAVRVAQKGKPIQTNPNKTASLLLNSTTHPSATPITVGVIGAGLMGSGIALVLLQAGFTVRLVDINEKALEKGVMFLKNTMTSYVKRGTWSKEKAHTISQQLSPTTSLQDLNDCILVVEAVVENLKIKQSIFQTLDTVTPPEALLLSNTSTLSIDAIASVLSKHRVSNCAGWHYFSPAHVMPLVEIVVGQHTSDTTIAILQALTKRIGKTGVTVGNCHGFVGNRMVAPYTGEACFLLADGLVPSVQAVDHALQNVFGMALGPFQMSDLAGNDIGYYIRQEQGLTRDPKTNLVGPKRGNMLRYTELADDMVTKLGRLGQKAGKGWYDYDPKVGKGRKGIPSPEMQSFIETYHPSTCEHNPRPPMLDSQGIIERVLFPLVNEGFKILEENMAQRPSDIDVIYLYGYGWPVWRGGPMFWADHEVGLEYLLTKLQEWYSMYPGSEWFRPSTLLETCVNQSIMVEDYYKQKEQHTMSGRSKL